jgi:hypothetical protein
MIGLALGVLAIGVLPASADNQLLVTSAAALPGSVAQPGVNCSGDGQPGPCGLEVVIDGPSNNTNGVYVSTQHPNAEVTYNFGFWIFPNDIQMPPTGEFVIGVLRKSTAGTQNIGFVYLRKTSNSKYWTIQSNTRQDNGLFQSWKSPVKICGDPTTTIPCSTEGPQEFSFEWAAATAPGANDGYWRVYKNGNLKKEWAALDNDTHDINEGRFGALFMANGNQGNTDGSFYWDTFYSNR